MKFNPDNLNIHELATQEPKRASVVFDPERELFEGDWDIIKERLEDCQDRGQTVDYAESLSYASIAFPEIFEKEANHKMFGILSDGCQSDYVAARFAMLSYAKICFPQDYQDNNLNELAEKKWIEYKTGIAEHKQDGDFHNLCPSLLKAKIIFPDKFNELGIEEQTYEGMRQYLMSNFSKDNDTSYKYYAQFLGSMRIIFPEKFSEFSPGEEDWNKMRETLENARTAGENWGFPLLAGNLKILAAEKVEITDKGLKITMPEEKESLQGETPVMPEQKQF